MTVSIHQPNYFPWLGYFYKIYNSDIFVFLDDVQFNNEGLQNYHYIKTPQGSLRLKVPVKHSHGDNINQVLINNSIDWRKKHLRTIEMNYKKASFFESVYADYKSLLEQNVELISELNFITTNFICQKFGFNTKVLKSSSLNINSVKTQRVIDICKMSGGTTYLSGLGAKAYQDENLFFNNNLSIKYSQFQPVEYKQLWGDFQSNVSVLDFCMNMGYDWQFILNSLAYGNR